MVLVLKNKCFIFEDLEEHLKFLWVESFGDEKERVHQCINVWREQGSKPYLFMEPSTVSHPNLPIGL